jgi:predicted transcriptional regulator
LLAREKEKRTHIYEPLIPEREVKDRFIDQLAEEAFKGSAMQLVMHALGRSKATKEEMDAIRQLLDDHNETS